MEFAVKFSMEWRQRTIFVILVSFLTFGIYSVGMFPIFMQILEIVPSWMWGIFVFMSLVIGLNFEFFGEIFWFEKCSSFLIVFVITSVYLQQNSFFKCRQDTTERHPKTVSRKVVFIQLYSLCLQQRQTPTTSTDL